MLKIACQKQLNGSMGRFLLDVELEIKDGDFIALYGESGSGKTTLLRLIAGFEKADGGSIKFGDRIFFNKQEFLPPQKRNIGFLFQDYALFENMNVLQNLLFAKNDIKLANNLLELIGLNELKNAKIFNLSGGQKQRIALARSLMLSPKILLLDEPLSALDNAMRGRLQEYLLKIHQEQKITIILVSHDVGEIYTLASKIFILDNGKITKNGTPNEIFLSQYGSQKLSFQGKIMQISRQDSIYQAVVLVGQNLCQIVLSPSEANNLKIGDEVVLSTKAFSINLKPNLKKVL